MGWSKEGSRITLETIRPQTTVKISGRKSFSIMNFTFRFFVSIFGDRAFWTNIKVFIVYLNIWRWGFWTILYNWMCNYYLLIDGLLSQNLDNNNSSILRTERDDIMAMRRLQFIALHWTKNPILSSSDAAGSGKNLDSLSVLKIDELLLSRFWLRRPSISR